MPETCYAKPASPENSFYCVELIQVEQDPIQRCFEICLQIKNKSKLSRRLHRGLRNCGAKNMEQLMLQSLMVHLA